MSTETEQRELTQEEYSELHELKRQMDLSSLGDRPHSIAASKLRRLIELERKERDRNRTAT